jgi:23S rRNA pseudouridine1911/1915/1917 synthase
MNEGQRLPTATEEAPLLAWLLEALKPMNRTRVKQLLKHGSVSVNGLPTTKHDHPLKPGDRVTVARGGAIADRSLEKAKIAIVYEDDALIAIDKPAGLLTVATEVERTDTAFARLITHLSTRDLGRPFVVHRLDRDTSGLLLFARSADSRNKLQEDWETVTKTYLAVVEGRPRQAEGIIDNFLAEGDDYRVRVGREGDANAKQAISRYKVLKTKERFSLIEVELITGRKHQIRVHLNGLACPIIGDPLYGKAANPAKRLGLHAAKLAFTHPITGERVQLESPLPYALRRICE